MSLPALQKSPPNTDISTTVNRLVREFNRQDRKAPIIGTDTGSGTAYVIAPVPGIKMYEVGQEFVFKAVNANTGTAPTLAVNGLTAGTITYPDGTPLVVGAIAAGSWVEVIVASVTSGTPTFVINAPRPLLSKITAVLGANVTITPAATWVDGPSIAQGASGLWLAGGTLSFVTGAAGDTIRAKLHDGTNVVAASQVSISAGASAGSISLGGIFTSPPGNIRMSGLAATRTDGGMIFNASGTSKDCSVWAVRIG
jgi:hypothetical protein